MKDKILLVRLSYLDTYYKEYPSFPAGLGILSEVLIFHNIEHEFYDMQIDNSVDKLINIIRNLQPARIGFSMMTFKYLHNYKLINYIKQQFPEIQIIVGGPHATTFKEKILEECEGVDIVVIMEGEETLVDLCNNKPLEEIKGIIFRKNGLIVSNKPRELILNLDKYPFPKLSKIKVNNYKSIPVISSRGCPYECIYCPVSTTIGKRWRSRNPEKIAEELSYWTSSGFNDIQILDDNFTFSKSRVLQICKAIKDYGIEDKINISLGNGVRADRVDRELLGIMRESGFYQISFGVESGNDRVLKTLNKGEDLKTIEKAIKLSCDLDYEVHLFFVLGTPGEREDDVYESIKIATKYPVSNIAFYHLIPFPGTRLYDWVDKNNRFRFKAPDFLNDASHWVNEPLFTTAELDIEQRKRLYSFANKIGFLNTKKRAYEMINKRLARKIYKKHKIPFFLAYIIMIIARSYFIKKYFKKTFIWNKAKNFFIN